MRSRELSFSPPINDRAERGPVAPILPAIRAQDARVQAHECREEHREEGERGRLLVQIGKPSRSVDRLAPSAGRTFRPQPGYPPLLFGTPDHAAPSPVPN